MEENFVEGKHKTSLVLSCLINKGPIPTKSLPQIRCGVGIQGGRNRKTGFRPRSGKGPGMTLFSPEWYIVMLENEKALITGGIERWQKQKRLK